MKNKNDTLKRLLSLALTGALMFSINTHAFERSAGDVDNNGNIDAKDCSVIVQKTINDSFTIDLYSIAKMASMASAVVCSLRVGCWRKGPTSATQ